MPSLHEVTRGDHFSQQTSSLPDTLPDRQSELEGNKDDDHPFEEIGVLDAHLIRQHRVVLPDNIDLTAHRRACKY